MRTKKCLVWAMVFLLNAMLLACGGGGGGGSTAVTPTSATGVFKDSNVSGLDYATSSGQTGITDQYGQYVYMTGDTVTFSIGGVILGSTIASGVVTPVDLVAGGSSSSPEVLNIVRFLMMLDSDGDPDNGINISTEVQDAADAWTQIDFSDPDFETNIAALITDCQIADSGAHNLPDDISAQSHLEASLRCVYSGAFRGTFSGSDSGTFGAIVDPQTGEVRGAAYSYSYDTTTEAYGISPIDYDQTMAFITGFVDSGAAFDGRLTSVNTMSGTWADNDPGGTDHGNFTGNRIGGIAAAAYRYTGVAYNDDGSTGAVLALDVNNGILTGVGYGIEDNNQFTLTGTLSGTTIAATTSQGIQINGTLYSDDTFYGTWHNPADGDSGTFDGCGCQLN
jgi:hypothetical protein